MTAPFMFFRRQKGRAWGMERWQALRRFGSPQDMWTGTPGRLHYAQSIVHLLFHGLGLVNVAQPYAIIDLQ